MYYTDPRALQRLKQFHEDPVILNDISCTGSEHSLTDCSQDGYGTFEGCSNIAVALCEGELSITVNRSNNNKHSILHFLLAIQLCNETGAIRLTHGTASLGRLEVCSGGHWGSVCIEGATNATATVACAQLNHAPQGTKSTIQWNSSKPDLLGTEKKIPDS